MRRLSGVLLAVALSGLVSVPASAQSEAWSNKWYWGAQAGTFIFSTPTQGNEVAFNVGGHWLITGQRVGLHLAVDQVIFAGSTTSAIADGSSPGGIRTVGFTSGRRWQGELYAMPNTGSLQVFAGGGFAIHHITDPAALGSFSSPQEEESVARILDDVSSKAFLILGGGVQWQVGNFVAFAKYQFMPEGRNFLINSGQHALTGGLRYALAAASEDVTTNR